MTPEQGKRWVEYCRKVHYARNPEGKKIKLDLDQMTREEIEAWIAQNIPKNTEEL